jgi:hypothetical protein
MAPSSTRICCSWWSCSTDTYQKFWALLAERRQAGRSVLIISHLWSTRTASTARFGSDPFSRGVARVLRPARPVRGLGFSQREVLGLTRLSWADDLLVGSAQPFRR